jgi:hypothetical protein
MRAKKGRRFQMLSPCMRCANNMCRCSYEISCREAVHRPYIPSILIGALGMESSMSFAKKKCSF